MTRPQTIAGRIVPAASALIAALALSAGPVRPAHAALGEEIPTGHPVYTLLRRLEAAGGLLPLHARTEPLTRRELLAALDETDGPTASGADSAWCARLRAEIREELTAEAVVSGDAVPGGPVATLRASVRSRLEADRGGRTRLRETLRAEGGIDLTPTLSLFESFALDTHGERDSDFSGRRWRDALTGRTERAGIAADWGRVGVFAGRSANRWADGESGGLAVSPASPPLDLVRARFDAGPLRLTSFSCALDEIPAGRSAAAADSGSELSRAEKRRFSAHRLDVRVARSLAIGLSETIVYGGPQRGFELAYVVPLFPYYAEAWNGPHDDNVVWGIDAVWIPRPGARARGELLIDDFQYDLKTEPHQIGWRLGADWSPGRGRSRTILSIEYARIETFVYGHFLARNRYLHDGVPLGDPLGPDSDRILGAASCDVSERATLAVELSRERHGAQTAETSQSTPANPRGLTFPSPPVREATRAALSASWRPGISRRIEATIVYGDDGVRSTGWSGQLALTLRADRRIAPVD